MLKNMEESHSKRLYEHKVRVRACGILVENDSILLLKHEGIGNDGFIWSPPGGGLEFDQDVHSTLIREYQEETNLTIQVDEFLFVNEYQSNNLHAIELFFKVIRIGGHEELGMDPELPEKEQILTELKWFDFDALNNIPKGNLHNIFHELDHPRMIVESTGFYKFGGISKK